MSIPGQVARAAAMHYFNKHLTGVSLGLWTFLSMAVLELGRRYHIRWADIPAGAIFAAGIAFSIHTLPETLGRMQRSPGPSFGRALALTLHSYVLLLTFLPVIGPRLDRSRALEKSESSSAAGEGPPPGQS